MGSKLLFVLGFGIILSMYGGGFATVPAYLADMFGTQFVGAIHGRLLTAWSTAGIIGPVVVNYIREFQLAAGVPRDQLYDTTMYILCAMLVAGLICNYLIKPVDPKWHMSEAEVAKLQAASAKRECGVQHGSFGIGKGGLDVRAALFWAVRRHPAGLGRLEDAGKRGQDLLIAASSPRDGMTSSRGVRFSNHIKKRDSGGFPMLRTSVCLAAMLLVAGSLHTASAQTTAPRHAGAATAKPSRMKLTHGEAEGDEGQVERQQAQAEGLPQRGEGQGTGRRRPLVLHRGLHGQDLSDLACQIGRFEGHDSAAACPLNAY